MPSQENDHRLMKKIILNNGIELPAVGFGTYKAT